MRRNIQGLPSKPDRLVSAKGEQADRAPAALPKRLRFGRRRIAHRVMILDSAQLPHAAADSRAHHLSLVTMTENDARAARLCAPKAQPGTRRVLDHASRMDEFHRMLSSLRTALAS